MEYTIYKLDFFNGVHFGKNSLDSTQNVFHADTLFSALCMEAIHRGQEMLERLVEGVKQDRLVFSDAFPYIGEEYFIPKPMLRIQHSADGDSVSKKAFKKMAFLPFSCLDQYLEGELPLEKTTEFQNLGHSVTKVSASVRGEENAVPYRVGVYYYHQNCGLYLILGYADEEMRILVEELLESLSYSGLGGKRASGLGRFVYSREKMPEEMKRRLLRHEGCLMTLSVSLPREEELEKALIQSSYLLEKRSGFVASDRYADGQQRKKDLFVFKAGSCFHYSFGGDVYDVSAGGRHKVYRYAKPLFMEVSG